MPLLPGGGGTVHTTLGVMRARRGLWAGLSVSLAGLISGVLTSGVYPAIYRLVRNAKGIHDER